MRRKTGLKRKSIHILFKTNATTREQIKPEVSAAVNKMSRKQHQLIQIRPQQIV